MKVKGEARAILLLPHAHVSLTRADRGRVLRAKTGTRRIDFLSDFPFPRLAPPSPFHFLTTSD